MTAARTLPGQPAALSADRPPLEVRIFPRSAPEANLRAVRLARRLLPQGGHLIDFGCGTGTHLSTLRGKAEIAAGYDLSDAALDRLATDMAELKGAAPVSLLGPEFRDLERHVAASGPADLILCLSGVLCHIQSRAARCDMLRALSGLLAPETGRLLISVPNRRRYFVAEQRAAGPGAEEIRYTRVTAQGSDEMSFRLYDPDSLADELRDGGFAVEAMAAQSLFSEAMTVRSPPLRALDWFAAPFMPARYGYDITGVARPLSAGNTPA
ncbi:class I SAM-dependent methyltransferase [Amaricoccus macauensis]|uniref:class I SAM-dependent methyltransferase n=1 Tax=Amaricoccus macauensis TaxID=57001 RepID=UPI003C7E269A